MVKYYHHVGVAGDRTKLRHAKVLAVRPDNEFKLVLSTGDVLLDWFGVKRVKTLTDDGELVEVEGGRYWSVDTYNLQEGGSKRVVADSIRMEGARFCKVINGAVDTFMASDAARGIPKDMFRSLNVSGGGGDSSAPSAETTHGSSIGECYSAVSLSLL